MVLLLSLIGIVTSTTLARANERVHNAACNKDVPDEIFDVAVELVFFSFSYKEVCVCVCFALGANFPFRSPLI